MGPPSLRALRGARDHRGAVAICGPVTAVWRCARDRMVSGATVGQLGQRR